MDELIRRGSRVSKRPLSLYTPLVANDGLTFSRGSNVDLDDEGAVIEGEQVD